MMTSIVVLILKYTLSSWDLQNPSLKVMLKSTWLNLVLSVYFMTLSILKLDFFLKNIFIFLKVIIYLSSSSQKFIENCHFLCTFIMLHTNIRQLHVQCHLLGHHLHNLLKHVDFSWNCFCHHKFLGYVKNMLLKHL